MLKGKPRCLLFAVNIDFPNFTFSAWKNMKYIYTRKKLNMKLTGFSTEKI